MRTVRTAVHRIVEIAVYAFEDLVEVCHGFLQVGLRQRSDTSARKSTARAPSREIFNALLQKKAPSGGRRPGAVQG